MSRISWSCPRVQAVLLKYDRAPAKAAEYLGCSCGAVLMARKRLGLSENRRIDWGPWDRLLGTMSDLRLAEHMGVSYNTVWRRRTELGIPAFGQWGGNTRGAR